MNTKKCLLMLGRVGFLRSPPGHQTPLNTPLADKVYVVSGDPNLVFSDEDGDRESSLTRTRTGTGNGEDEA